MRRVLIPLNVSPDLPVAGSVLHDAGGSSMGTTWSARVMLPPDGGQIVPAECLQQQLDAVVAQMSHWEIDSDLGRFNSAPAGSWHQLPEEFFSVLSFALEVARATSGAYDPCAGALVNRWGFGARRRYDEANFYAPADSAVRAILERKDRQSIAIDPAARRVQQPGEVQLDLSSVAKGFAVDQLARCLESRGVRHYLVEVGGELRGAGLKPDGQPWWVALEGVPDTGAADPVVLALHGLSVATSGDYRRYYQHEGMRASHTLDPRTGYPIRNELASVTVIHPECMAADAWSTALTVLGPQDGLRIAEEQRLAARFLVRSAGRLEETCSTAFKELLQ